MSKLAALEHIAEIRNRLIFVVIIFIASSAVGYILSEYVMDFLLDPLNSALKTLKVDRKLIFTSLTEAFTTKVKLSLFCGFLISVPVAFINIYLFCAPGLFRSEKRIAMLYLAASPFLFYVGAFLSYFFVMPLAWKFFLSFESTFMSGQLPLILEAKISDYLSLSTSMIVAFGFAFQLPLLLLFFIQMSFIKTRTLKIYRRHTIVVILVISAIITPPDIISQIILTIPLYILFEGTILLGDRIFKKRK